MAACSVQSEMDVEGERMGGTQGCEIAEFDYCVDNFFSDMDGICKLCSSLSKPDLDLADIDRFSSMITFLRYVSLQSYD
jgi:hypothetical protein